MIAQYLDGRFLTYTLTAQAPVVLFLLMVNLIMLLLITSKMLYSCLTHKDDYVANLKYKDNVEWV